VKIRSRVLVAAGAALLLSACQSQSDTDHPASVGIAITDAWARATPAATNVGAAYFTLTNSTAEADTLRSVTTPAAARAELHRTTNENGMAHMRPAGEIAVPAGQTVKAEPGGLHVMLYELARPLAAGDSVPLTLTFARAGAVTVTLEVRPLTSGGPGDQPGH
jgi:copper(I)-binding protein